MPISPSFSYELNGHTYTNLTWDADSLSALAGTANDIATIVNAVASDLANFNWGGLAGGSANALTLTPTPALGALVSGTRYVFLPPLNNTAAVTMNVSGTGAVAVLRPNGDPLEEGDLKAGEPAFIIFDGTDWLLTNWFPAAAAAFEPGAATKQAVTDAFAVTLPAAKMVDKVIVRSGPSSNFTDTPDSAANLVAAASEPFAGGYFPLMLINTTGFQWTISGGTGITYTTPNGSSIVVASGNAKIVWVNFTNVSGGTEAVQLFGGDEGIGGDSVILGDLNVQGSLLVLNDAIVDGNFSSSGSAGFTGNLAVSSAAAIAGNMSVGGSLSVGTGGAYYLNLAGNNAQIVFDSGDYLYFDRVANQLHLVVGGSIVATWP